MRRQLYAYLIRLLRWITPKPDYAEEARVLRGQLAESNARESQYRADYMERAAELIEAKQMCGSGPWLVHEARGQVDTPGARLREADPLLSQGAYGDIDLALQNVEWRRQVNLSWLEFSRWGIQQIVLISRLYYLKNPICRRLVDVVAAYVFARGVEVTTNDDTANEVLREFFERNKKVLGQNALVDLERRKDTDGNLFWVFFADKQNAGMTSIRTIDATEIADIICDPDDSDTPWLYRRLWDQRSFDAQLGQTAVEQRQAWYPALGHEPAQKPETINGYPVFWDQPILHRKCGAIAKWHFGCPRIYPMLDWAREARKFLEACASIRQSLSQVAMTFTTKGGQQAIEGAKAQLSTTVGPTNQVWDTNPTSVKGSTFASGPGTKLEAFKTSGSGFSPEDVRQYKLMCCMVAGVPETFLADVSTGNLATATSLDRPTETVFLEKQEAWREDLTTIAQFVLKISQGAPSGALRESAGAGVLIIECARKHKADGMWVYEAIGTRTAKEPIKIQVNFPAIREGDIPALVGATVAAMTLGSRGQVVGIDEKTGVALLLDQLGVEDGQAIVETMYPEASYDPEREQSEPVTPTTGPKPTAEAIREALAKLTKATEAMERNRATHPDHIHGD